MWVPRRGARALEQIRLERDHLQRATYAANRLVLRFPRVLPYLVDDVDRWTNGVPQVLAWLKDAIHRRQPLPASLINIDGVFSYTAVEQAVSLAKRHPALRPLLDALSWITFLTPKELPQTLSWLEEHAPALETVLAVRPGLDGISVVLLLWELARRDGRRRVTPLLQFVGDRRAFTITMRGTAKSHLAAWIEALKRAAEDKLLSRAPDRPQPRFGSTVLAFIDWILQQDQASRRRALGLFALLYPDDLLDRWEGWWAEVDPLLTRARRLASIPQNDATRIEIDEVKVRLEALMFQIPPSPHTERTMADVRVASASGNAQLHRQIIATLKRLPVVQKHPEVPIHLLVRPALLSHWLKIDPAKPDGVAVLLRAFRSYLTRHRRLETLLHPWHHVMLAWNQPHPRYRWGLLDMLFAEITDARLWPTVFDTVAACQAASDDPLPSRDGERIAALVKLTNDARQAAVYFLALTEGDLRAAYLPDTVLRCAHALAEGSEHFAQLVAALRKLYSDDERLADVLTTTATRLDATGWTGLTAQLILDGALNEVRGVGQRFMVLRAMGETVDPPARPPAAEAPAWSRRYPPSFAPALAVLAAVTPESKRIAGRVLGKDFPNPDKIQREIDAIASRLAAQPDEAGLAQRLDNLHARLTSTRALSAARMARHAGKLDRATRHAVLHAWQHRLDDTLRARLPRLLDVDEAPDWLLHPHQLQILEPLLALPHAFRDLGLRLLRHRCGPPPWTLIQDPANQAFLARLRTLGIDPEPWIHPSSPWAWTGENERTVYVAFEDDPLEIFHMGGHFKTCLSPGAFNFFSVFANAADINKRLVYARDDQGRVVGRCLFAMSDEGRLLTFEPYCHDQSLGFAAMMGRLAEETAEAMGAIIATRGQVSCLVAPDWYDDGSQDLCNRFAFLKSDSPLREALPCLELEELVPTLEAAFDPLPLNALTLPLVLDLSELGDRPALVLPLLPYIEASKGLADSAWVRAARLAHRAGASGFTHRALRRRAVPYILAMHRRQDWLDTQTIDVLVDLEPSTALQVLRRTRPRGVRSDEEETLPERRALLARAHEALSRPARAQRLREKR